MALNKFSTPRLLWGFAFIVFGLGQIFDWFPLQKVYFFEYRYFIGGVFVVLGCWSAYRAFAKY